MGTLLDRRRSRTSTRRRLAAKRGCSRSCPWSSPGMRQPSRPRFHANAVMPVSEGGWRADTAAAGRATGKRRGRACSLLDASVVRVRRRAGCHMHQQCCAACGLVIDGAVSAVSATCPRLQLLHLGPRTMRNRSIIAQISRNDETRDETDQLFVSGCGEHKSPLRMCCTIGQNLRTLNADK